MDWAFPSIVSSRVHLLSYPLLRRPVFVVSTSLSTSILSTAFLFGPALLLQSSLLLLRRPWWISDLPLSAPTSLPTALDLNGIPSGIDRQNH